MAKFICKTCGTQFPESSDPPEHCPICEDDRQYTGWDGQQWTTLEELQKDHHNRIQTLEPGLTGIASEPGIAIGQRALLTGDIINVVSDRRYVSFMYSFPNLIPLPEGKVRRIVTAVQDLPFDRIYGAWWGREILNGAKDAIKHSSERYIQAISGDGLSK